jgi:hypothetical protein
VRLEFKQYNDLDGNLIKEGKDVRTELVLVTTKGFGKILILKRVCVF